MMKRRAPSGASGYLEGMDGWWLLPVAVAMAACTEHVVSAAPPDATEAVDPPSDPPEAKAARERLVVRITARYAISPRVVGAMRDVPRHLFVDTSIERAYRDRPLPIGWGQTISQPSIVALMSELLDLAGQERVLEIGTGSGYQAAVLARLAAHVDTIEIIPALAESARTRLKALGYANVDVRTGDGYQGWPERAPFDRILLTAAPPSVPTVLLDQLAEGGILVAPVGPEDAQRLVRWRKRAGKLVEDVGRRVVFVPMVPGTG
jgi:protein-L-isoaspartate(D-aspartate) O-methyltransferase